MGEQQDAQMDNIVKVLKRAIEMVQAPQPSDLFSREYDDGLFLFGVYLRGDGQFPIGIVDFNGDVADMRDAFSTVLATISKVIDDRANSLGRPEFPAQCALQAVAKKGDLKGQTRVLVDKVIKVDR